MSKKTSTQNTTANKAILVCDTALCEALKRRQEAEADTSGGFIDRVQANKDRELITRAGLAGRGEDIIDAAIRKGKEGGGFEPTTANAAARLIEESLAKAALTGVELTPEQRAKIIEDVLETRLGGQFWGGKGKPLVGGSGTPEQKIKTKLENDLLTRAGIPNGQITEREKILGGAQPDDRSSRAGEVETLGGDRTNAADYLALDEFKRVSTRPSVTDSEIADAYNTFIKKVGENAAAREAAEIRAEERAWENTTDYSGNDSGSGDNSNSTQGAPGTGDLDNGIPDTEVPSAKEPGPATPGAAPNPEPAANPEPEPEPELEPNPEPEPAPAPGSSAGSEPSPAPSPGPNPESTDSEETDTEVSGTLVIRDRDGNVIVEETTSGENNTNEDNADDNNSNEDNADEDKTDEDKSDKGNTDEDKADEDQSDEDKTDEETTEDDGTKPINPNYDDGIVLNKKTDLEIWQERRDAQRGIQSSGPDSDLGANEALERVESSTPPPRQGPQIDYEDQPRGQDGAYIDPFANRNPSGGIIGFESDSTDNNSDDSNSGNEYRPETPVQRTLAPPPEERKPESGKEKPKSDKNKGG